MLFDVVNNSDTPFMKLLHCIHESMFKKGLSVPSQISYQGSAKVVYAVKSL